MFHSLGSGSDSSLPFTLGLDAACTAAVLAAVAWRVGTGRTFSAGRRVAAPWRPSSSFFAIAVFATLGPLRPGWSHRAGTSTALLTQLARESAAAPPAVTPAVSRGGNRAALPHSPTT